MKKRIVSKSNIPFNITDKENLKKLNDFIKTGNYKYLLTKKAKKTVGRNELCPCGSGKKYKKCCMGK